MPQKKQKRLFLGSLLGTGIVAVCCFTPALVVSLGLVGLGSLVPALDFILFPSLAILIVATIINYRKWRQACHLDNCDHEKTPTSQNTTRTN